jgi:hypothetical protein
VSLADDLRAVAIDYDLLSDDLCDKGAEYPPDMLTLVSRLRTLADAIEQYYTAHTADQPSGDDVVFSYMRLHTLIKGDPTP